jgi:hypothetical protein
MIIRRYPAFLELSDETWPRIASGVFAVDNDPSDLSAEQGAKEGMSVLYSDSELSLSFGGCLKQEIQ